MQGRPSDSEKGKTWEELKKVHTRLDKVEKRLTFLEKQKQVLRRDYGTPSS